MAVVYFAGPLCKRKAAPFSPLAAGALVLGPCIPVLGEVFNHTGVAVIALLMRSMGAVACVPLLYYGGETAACVDSLGLVWHSTTRVAEPVARQ